MPWPSGPVVISTPSVCPYSGWPGVSEPHVRSAFEVVELEAVAAEVELDVLRQRAVARRQDEAVAAEPVLVARVAAHHLLEQQVRRRREAHGGAGMPVAHLLDRVRRENASGVYCLVVNGIPLQSCHVKTDPS